MVSMILMASWMRPSLVLVEDWYVDGLGFFLVNSRWTLGLQPPNIKKDARKCERIQQMVLLLGRGGFVLNDEGKEWGGIHGKNKFKIG